MTDGAVYCDASALVKLLLPEAESDALREFVGRSVVFSSQVAAVEVGRAVRRGTPLLIDAQIAEGLAHVVLLSLDEGIVERAARLAPASLKALDAIHLATGMRIGHEIRAFVCYDRQLFRAAEAVGLPVVAPA